MKHAFIALLMTLAAQMSFAAHNSCSFPYDLSEDDGVQSVRSFSINHKTKLTALQEAQLRIMDARNPDETSDGTLSGIIDSLKDASEAGDLVYEIFRFEDKVYSIIKIYPGGNPYGVIFQGTKVIAELHDGDVVCE